MHDAHRLVCWRIAMMINRQMTTCDWPPEFWMAFFFLTLHAFFILEQIGGLHGLWLYDD